MDTPDARRAEDRRRRTERQREKRSQDRICGYCRKPAAAGLIEWFGRGRPLRIPICLECRARLDGDWRLMEEAGIRCAVGEPRPCSDCISSPSVSGPQPGIFRRLFGQ